MDLLVPVNHWVKIKASKKRDKDLDLARGPKKKAMKNKDDSDINCSLCIWSSPGRLGKGLRRIGNQKENLDIQTIALLKLARILRKVLETTANSLSVRPAWNPTNQRWCEKLTRSKMIKEMLIRKVCIKRDRYSNAKIEHKNIIIKKYNNNNNNNERIRTV